MDKRCTLISHPYVSVNRIPYAYGEQAKVADVSGENFILGLLTMGPVHIDEKYRDNYVTVVGISVGRSPIRSVGLVHRFGRSVARSVARPFGRSDMWSV